MNKELIAFRNTEFCKRCETWLCGNLKAHGPILFSTLGQGHFLPDGVTVADWVSSIPGIVSHSDLGADNYCESEERTPDNRCRRTSPSILPRWMNRAAKKHLFQTQKASRRAPLTVRKTTLGSVWRWVWRFITGWLHGKKHIASKVWVELINQLESDPSLTAWVEYRDGRQSFTASAYLRGDRDSMVLRSHGVGFVVLREEVSALKLVPKEHQNAEMPLGSTCWCKVTAWYADKGEFGFARDVNDFTTYFFNRQTIRDYLLLETLSRGELGQRVECRILNRARGDKYARVEVLQVERTVGKSVGPLPVGNSPKAKAVRAEHAGDLKLAESLYLNILRNPCDSDFEPALKNLAGIYNRSDSNRAIALLNEYEQYVSDECKVTLDHLRYLYFRRAGRDSEAYEVAQKLLRIKPNAAYTKFVTSFRKRKHLNVAPDKKSVRSVNMPDMIPSDTRYGEYLMRTADFEGWSPEDAEPNVIQGRLDQLKKEGAPNLSAKVRTAPLRDSCCEESLAMYSLRRATLRYWWAEKTDRLVAMGDARSEWRYYFYWIARKFAADGGCYCLEQIETMIVWAARCAKRGNIDDYCQLAFPIILARLELGADPKDVWMSVENKSEVELKLELPAVRAEVVASERTQTRLEALLTDYALADVMPNLAVISNVMGRINSNYERTLVRVTKLISDNNHLSFSSELVSDVKEIVELVSPRSESDKERLGQLYIILRLVEDYVSSVNYARKRTLCNDLDKQWERFVERYVHCSPTLFTTDVYFPLLGFLQDCVKADFAQTSMRPVPLNLEIVSEPLQTEDGTSIDLKLTSIDESSPMIASAAFFAKRDGSAVADTPVAIYSGAGVEGGSAYPFRINVTPSELEKASGVALVKIVVRYATDGGFEGESEFACQFKLLNREDLLDEENPYLAFQGTVALGDYFVGREEEMSRIRKCFAGSRGGQCFVLWGQRRSGKTSIRDNFSEELRKTAPDVVFVSLDAQNWGDDYVRQFTTSLCSSVESQCFVQGVQGLINDKIPGLDAIDENAYDVRIRRTVDFLWRMNKTLIVAIDEASTPFNNFLDRGRRDEDKFAAIDFLRFLKSLVNGARLFHLLLIGQDMMKDFLDDDEFGNEFSVCSDKELSYLTKDDVRKLFVRGFPNTKSGKERITPDAFEEMYRLTHGAPLFVQYFCATLYDYLYENELPVADLHAVRASVDILCKGRDDGEGGLAWRSFEQWTNLRVPGVVTKDVKDFFLKFAAKSGRSAWCLREELVSTEKDSLIFDTLKTRHVFNERAGRYRILVELFNEWLIVNGGRENAEG